MNENIDLTKILKDCPKGTKLYSTILGDVSLKEINSSEYPIVVSTKDYSSVESFTKNGKLLQDYNGECTLFPSKDQRDWSKFTAPWYKKERYTIALLEKQYEQKKQIHFPKFTFDDVLALRDALKQCEEFTDDIKSLL